MKKFNLSGATKAATLGLKKHSPEILTGIGIAGMVSTTILAVKATPKAVQLIEDEKNRINYEICKVARDNGDDECPQIDKLKPLDMMKITWRCYFPAAALGTVSIMCLIGASSVSARRNAALATAYAMTESSFKTYRDKVVETVGEKKTEAIKDAIAKEEIERNPVSSNTVIATGNGETLCYDPWSGRYFKSDIEKIKKGLNDTNYSLIGQSYVSLNDFYSNIGLEHTKIGDDMGWNIAHSKIELSFSSQLTDDGTPCLVFDFEEPPHYDFDRWL